MKVPVSRAAVDRIAVATLLAGVVAVADPGSTLAAPPDAVATAAYGASEIWLQRDPDDRARRQLVVKEGGDAMPRVLLTAPPRNRRMQSSWAENLALGLDAGGRLTAVLQSNRGLYWTHVAGKPRLRLVPGTTRNDTFPSLFKGKLAYGSRSGQRSIVRLASLTRGGTRTVWSDSADLERSAIETAVGAANAVVVVTVRDGAGNGIYATELARPGRKPKRLLRLGLGDSHEGGLAIRRVTTDGRRVVISRDFDETHQAVTFALPSGRKLSTR